MQALCETPSNAVYGTGMQTGRPCDRPRPAFGARLHALREATGLTQAQVAHALGISARAYAFWEREPVAVKTEQLATLAKLFSCSVDALVCEEVPRQRGNGPSGKARLIFEEVSKLPRNRQQRILATVADMLTAQRVAASS